MQPTTDVPFPGNHEQGNGADPKWLNKRTLALAIGALGVVYGDLGTSPLYTIEECFHGKHAIALNDANILGVMSLVFWSLTIVVSVKYVFFILRADNHGEGGIFALLGLLGDRAKMSPRLKSVVVMSGIIGAGLLYGDGVITPAISVLSAIEGLAIATTAAKPFVLPLTCGVLFLLFFLQHRGTADIGKMFGPVMTVWFLVIAALGIGQVVQEPRILSAINPVHAYGLFSKSHMHAFVVLGSVVLCFTGAEALYADLGHFGRKAIRLGWMGIAYPALLCNYFGQTALLLMQPDIGVNPFYGVVPRVLLFPMVALSTVATVIASQALISGVFSLTQQAIELGFAPRFLTVHTSREIRGQIYMPAVNYALMFGCLGVVIGFGESGRLAGAYGIAVTGTMAITSILYFLLTTRAWGWPYWKAVPLIVVFLILDLSYLGANLFKVIDGGWFTLLVAALLTLGMTTWIKGRSELIAKIGTRLPLDLFLEDLAKRNLPRVRGTAVFMSVTPKGTSPVLLHHLKHNKVLHDKIVLLSILPAGIPFVPAAKRVQVEDLGQGFHRVVAHNGFMQRPNVPEILRQAANSGLRIDTRDLSYILGRVTVFTTGKTSMSRWRKKLFAYIAKNAGTPAAYFGLPVNQVVELGAQIEL